VTDGRKDGQNCYDIMAICMQLSFYITKVCSKFDVDRLLCNVTGIVWLNLAIYTTHLKIKD